MPIFGVSLIGNNPKMRSNSESKMLIGWRANYEATWGRQQTDSKIESIWNWPSYVRSLEVIKIANCWLVESNRMNLEIKASDQEDQNSFIRNFRAKIEKKFWGHLKVTEMALKSIGSSRATFCLNQKLETKAKLEVIRSQASKMLIGWDQMTKIFSLEGAIESTEELNQGQIIFGSLKVTIRARKFFSRHKKPSSSHNNNNNNDTSSSEFFENNKKWKQQNVKRQDDLDR